MADELQATRATQKGRYRRRLSSKSCWTESAVLGIQGLVHENHELATLRKDL